MFFSKWFPLPGHLLTVLFLKNCWCGCHLRDTRKANLLSLHQPSNGFTQNLRFPVSSPLLPEPACLLENRSVTEGVHHSVFCRRWLTGISAWKAGFHSQVGLKVTANYSLSLELESHRSTCNGGSPRTKDLLLLLYSMSTFQTFW